MKVMQWRRLKYAILRAVGPWLIGSALWLLRRTLRMKFRYDDAIVVQARKGTSFILAFWHCDMIAALFVAAHMIKRGVGNCSVLASLSEDGELLARTVRRFGVGAVRGSSSRGARSGLKGLESHINAGGHVGLAVDGPRGPRHNAKIGVALIAKDTGALILPMTVRYERSWRFKSWDRTELPKLFSRCEATFHSPIAVTPTADRHELELARARVEQILLRQSEMNVEL